MAAEARPALPRASGEKHGRPMPPGRHGRLPCSPPRSSLKHPLLALRSSGASAAAAVRRPSLIYPPAFFFLAAAGDSFGSEPI